MKPEDVVKLAFLCFVGGACIGLFLKHVKKKKAIKSLVRIIEEYKRIGLDERCRKAIRESGIVMELLIAGGEYLFIPLQKSRAGYTLRYDSKTVRLW